MRRERLLEVARKIAPFEKIRADGDEIVFPCPLAPWTHDGGVDRHPSFGIKASDTEPSVFFCFACGAKGRLSDLVIRLNALRKGALEETMDQVLCEERADAQSRIVRALVPIPTREPVLDVWDEVALAPFSGHVPSYALRRGLPLEICREYELGWDAKERRLVFPVRRSDGALVGVTGRAVPDEIQPRYRDYRGFEKGRYLYCEHKLVPGGRVVVVEGFVDALIVRAAGVENAVATMGARVTKHQVRRLLDLNRPIYLMQDGDKAGREARAACVRAMHGRTTLFDVPLPVDGDPDEMTRGQILDALSRAKIIL